MYLTVISIQMIQSGHGFAHVIQAEMLWHVNDFEPKFCFYKMS